MNESILLKEWEKYLFRYMRQNSNNNPSPRMAFIEGAKYAIKKWEDSSTASAINDFPIDKKLKYEIACLITAYMAKYGIDIPEDVQQKFQDNDSQSLIDSVLDAIIEWEDSSGKETGMKWVKASERLPDKSGDYHCKVVFPKTMSGKYIYNFDSDTKKFCDEVGILHTNSVAWLDESVPPYKEEETELKMVDLPRPIGDFILAQKDIKFEQTSFGVFYHYKDVVTLLSRYKPTCKEEVDKEEYAHTFNKAIRLLEKAFLKAKEPLATDIYDFLHPQLTNQSKEEAGMKDADHG